MTERLFLEDPVRAHCLAEVREVRGPSVVLTRTVLYGESPAYGHEQPGDRGHLLAEGRKIKVDRARERDASLLHHLAGTPPAVGARVQVHLDLPRRLLASRAHTLAHLLVHVAPHVGIRCLAAPSVVGGGGVRVRVVGPLAGLVPRLRDVVEEDRRVTTRWMLPEAAPAPDPWPRPRVEGALRVVEIEQVGGFPCDGTHARRTSEVGAFRARVRPGKAGETELALDVEKD